MERDTTPLQPFKDEAHPLTGPRRITLTFLLVTILLDPGATSGNPHQPAKITWKLQNGLMQEVLNSTSGIHPPNTWWPDLYFDLKEVVGVPWAKGLLRHYGFWACPGHQRSNWKTCGGLQDYFCKSWTYVTSNDGNWRWEVGNQDLLNFLFTRPSAQALGDPYYNCDDYDDAQVKIRFNPEAAKKERSWVSGLP